MQRGGSGGRSRAFHLHNCRDLLQLADALSHRPILVSEVIGMEEIDLDRQKTLISHARQQSCQLQVVNNSVADRRTGEEIPLVRSHTLLRL